MRRILLALAVLATGCSSSGAIDARKPHRDLLLVASFRALTRDAPGRLELVDTRGRVVRTLATRYVVSASSPDGERIAATGGGGAVLLDVNGRVRRRVASGRLLRPVFSPDGTTLAAVEELGMDPGFDPDHSHRLVLLPVEGGKRRVIAGNVRVCAWAPARELLVQDHGELTAMNADGTVARRLVENAGCGVWSPDGRRIAYLRWHDLGERSWIEVAHADGSHAHVVWRGTRLVSARAPFGWTRDGWIVFTREVAPDDPFCCSDTDDFHEHVFAVRPDGTGVHMLAHRPGRREAFVFTRP